MLAKGATDRGKRPVGLESVTRYWPTPQAADGERASETLFRGEANPTLLGAARSVSARPTPTVHGNHNRAGCSATSGDGLATATRLWPTPTSADMDRSTDGQARAGGPSLTMATRLWNTPRTADGGARTGFGLRDQATGHPRSRPDPRIGTPGEPSLTHGLTWRQPLRLNPRFVAWLMGLHPMWTSLAPINSAPSATPSSPTRPPSPGGSSGRASMPTDVRAAHPAREGAPR